MNPENNNNNEVNLKAEVLKSTDFWFKTFEKMAKRSLQFVAVVLAATILVSGYRVMEQQESAITSLVKDKETLVGRLEKAANEKVKEAVDANRHLLDVTISPSSSFDEVKWYNPTVTAAAPASTEESWTTKIKAKLGLATK